MHEEDVMDLLRKSGIQVIEQQRPFMWEEIELSGKIDCVLKLNGTDGIPTEIKSMNGFDWEKTNSLDDMKASKKHWIRGYVAQLMFYLLMSNKPFGMFILKNKSTGALKQIDCDLDYEYAENLVKKLELVNKHVKANTYPERIDDRDVCKYCDFKSTCLPDEGWGSISIEDSKETALRLVKWAFLKPLANEYAKINDLLKKVWGEKKEGEYLYDGRFSVTVKKQKRTAYVIPAEVKQKYAEETEITKTKVVDLKAKGESNDKDD